MKKVILFIEDYLFDEASFVAEKLGMKVSSYIVFAASHQIHSTVRLIKNAKGHK